ISPFVVQPVPLEVTEGSVARFTCQVTSNPPATITWELDQSTLPLETDRITVLPNGALQIQNVQLEDAGKYRCVATNIGNRVKSRKATLSVINQGSGPKPRQRPRIIAGPQNMTASLHYTVVLECVATGNPRPIISWSRADSKPIDVFNARVLGSGNLVISDVKPQHSGVYLCRATTPRTRNYTIATANLTVLASTHASKYLQTEYTFEKCPRFAYFDVDLYFRPSRTPNLRPRSSVSPHHWWRDPEPDPPQGWHCPSRVPGSGVPPPRITWLKNGEEVHLNGRIKMYNSKLVITQITTEDDAIYQCVAGESNRAVFCPWHASS
ncbi:protogenin-like, partial [Oncorhynchus keta]|uniref:protogenin-like n=1 Tax=Oncorhynchus keta TaxID=8018 RepID=UPI00227C760D